MVGTGPARDTASPRDLDELINETIQRARESGYSLRSPRERVRERLRAEPPDHLLVVENEAGIREILQAEIRGYLAAQPVHRCGGV